MKDRIWGIINIIIRSGPVSSHDLARIFSVTTRTIRNDLLEIEKIIAKYSLELQRKRNIGISIVGKQKDLYLLTISKEANSNKSNKILSEERRELILLEILLNQTIFYPIYFESKYFISNSTLNNDLNKIESKLKETNLGMEKDKEGRFVVTGPEENIRELISKLLNSNCMNDFFSKEKKDSYLNLITNKYDSVIKILDNIQIKYNFTLEESVYENLVIHLTIMIDRLKHGNAIAIEQDIMVNMIKRKEYLIAKEISDELSKKFNISINECEIVYIAIHIIDFKLKNYSIIGSELEINGMTVFNAVDKIIEDFVFMINKVLGADLAQDFRFINALRLHLIPTIDRLQLRIKLTNPLLDDIKENYTNLYAISGLINTSVNKYTKLQLTEDEIGYITLHLAAAVERVNSKIKVLVICHLGVGTSQLISSRIENRFPQLWIKDIQSNSNVYINNEDFDVIISTKNDVQADIPVLKVTPFITELDMDKIQIYIEHFSTKSISNIFDLDLIFLESYKNKKEVIESNSQVLIDFGYVDETFTKSVYHRESLTSTEVGKGVVLTHGFPDHVIKSKVVLTILDKPIFWNESFIQIIIMLAITKEDIKRNAYRLDWLYKSLNDQDFLDIILNAENREILFKELIEQMNIVDRI